MKTRIKICGIKHLKDAMAAIDAGADALGFVFYHKSPRFISLDDARNIIEKLPPFITTVGLCVNADEETIKQIIDTGIDIMQFHGDELANYCDGFNFPYIRAVRVSTTDDIYAAEKNFNKAKALLLDAYDPKVYGGTGKSFNWELIPNDLTKPVILAGGLNADNVTEAISEVKPFAVDVSGGVESQTGIKSKEKIRAFCQAVALV
ncbi:MAG: phosphoribosylanthranilate isomerase [Francisellaceae bacterium]